MNAYCFRAVRASVRPLVIIIDNLGLLKVCYHDILQTACGNFSKFTTLVQLGTKMNCLDFEVKRSKIKVTRDKIW